MQKFTADPIVDSDPARHFLYIGARTLGEIGNLVDEGNLGRQKRVSGIFDQFCGAPASIHDRRLVQIKRTVDLSDNLARAFVFGSDYNAIGMLEIADCSTLAQKFRIGRDDNVGLGIGL